MRPQDVSVGMAVEFGGLAGSVMKRDGPRVRVDFGESKRWLRADELQPAETAQPVTESMAPEPGPTSRPVAANMLPQSEPKSEQEPELKLEPEPEPELEIEPEPEPEPEGEPDTVQLETVDEQTSSEHPARSPPVAEASEQEVLLRASQGRQASGTSSSPVSATPRTPVSSPAARRWRKAGIAARTPYWLRVQVRDELQINIGHTSKQGNARAHPNEDRVVVECNVAKQGVMLLAVIDGHGGSGVADLLHDRLVGAISAAPAFQSSPPDLAGAIRQAFRWCNAQCRTAWKDTAEGSGACVVVALIVAEGPAGSRRCVVGWVGDSRAVLCDRDGGVLALTQDHDPDTPAERERILAAGGIVTEEGRVQVAAPMVSPPLSTMTTDGKSHSNRSSAGSPVESPAANITPVPGEGSCVDSGSDSDESTGCAVRQVAVARDIGDTLLEARFGGAAAVSPGTVADIAATTLEGDTDGPISPEIISCEPDITEVTLEAGRDALLILGSDGLFAPLENDAVGSFAHSLWQSGSGGNHESGATESSTMMKPKVLSNKLVQKAKRVRGNNDDTTAMVLRLSSAKPGESSGVLELDAKSDDKTDVADVAKVSLEPQAPPATHVVSGTMNASPGPTSMAPAQSTSVRPTSLPMPTSSAVTTRRSGRAVTVSLATPRAGVIGTPRLASTTETDRRRHRSIGGNNVAIADVSA